MTVALKRRRLAEEVVRLDKLECARCGHVLGCHRLAAPYACNMGMVERECTCVGFVESTRCGRCNKLISFSEVARWIPMGPDEGKPFCRNCWKATYVRDDVPVRKTPSS